MPKGKIVLAGGSGFLGVVLGKWLSERGFEIVVLSRRATPRAEGRCIQWDGETLGEWANELEGAAALVNLAGRSVNCRYHARNRRQMMDSRILSTRVLGQAVVNCVTPPQTWLNSSTATIYKHTYGDAYGEDGDIAATREAKDEFSIQVARAWEQEFARAACPDTRKIVLRSAIVLDAVSGTAYEVLRRLATCGLGGAMGGGKQFVSWIHAEDFCRSVTWLIEHPSAVGNYNIAAPNPVTNGDLMRMIRRAVRMPIGLPASRWMLEMGAILLRTETELIIKSRRVVPTRLIAEGFTFEFPTLRSAIASLESRRCDTRSQSAVKSKQR
ncbi:MAG: TIGR01777 family oxidoreductase [Planctomycetota bacterium]|nr:TIGR01777 family oxidoreductase [Planctomycetota bacterium]